MLDQTSHKAGGTDAPHAPASIAFGVERLGLVAMRTPIMSVVILAILCIGAFFGLERIRIDDSLSQLFRSNTKEFRQYEAVTKRFPATEFDVLVIIEGKSLLERASLEKLRDLVTDIQLVDGTRGIISLFSARQAPEAGKLPAALFPETLPEGAAYDKFIETVRTNEILRGKLLSDDGTLTLIVLALDPAVVSSKRLGPVVGEIRKLLSDTVKGTHLIGQLSGVPIMQLEIRNAVARDGIIYNVAGVLAGCLIAIIFFRRISFMIIAAFPPILAILLSLGTLGWFNFSLNMFLNVMTPLIMVISFRCSSRSRRATG
jgi:predicted RND superfamily exporter protein